MSSLGKSLVYGVVDLVTARQGVPRRVGGETIRFPPRFCRYYEPDYEPETFAFLRRSCHKGDAVLDIGAHIGLFTVVMARLVGPEGRVFSFEPTPSTRAVLERTVRLNHCGDRAEIRPEAVTRTSGKSEFFDTADIVSNANSLVATDRHRTGFTVDTVSVDDFVAARALRVSCLKIDVEGAELDALHGAENTLGTQRPAMALALHPAAVERGGGNLRDIWRLLASQRFEVRHRGRAVEEEWFCRQDGLFDVQCTSMGL